jgi:hypothetical protein
MTSHPRVVFVLIADTGTIDPATSTNAKSVPSEIQRAIFVILEKLILSSFFASLAACYLYVCIRKHYKASVFVVIGILMVILSS